jgi:hypothetical protein
MNFLPSRRRLNPAVSQNPRSNVTGGKTTAGKPSRFACFCSTISSEYVCEPGYGLCTGCGTPILGQRRRNEIELCAPVLKNDLFSNLSAAETTLFHLAGDSHEIGRQSGRRSNGPGTFSSVPLNAAAHLPSSTAGELPEIGRDWPKLAVDVLTALCQARAMTSAAGNQFSFMRVAPST